MFIRSLSMIALVMLGACSRPPTLSIDKGYIRLNAVPSRPAVAYFTIRGGTADVTLLSITSPVSVKSELHQSMTSANMATMAPINDFKVRGGTINVFAPGGKHLMLFDMNPGVKAGRIVPLTFTFSNGQRIDCDAKTIAAGAPVPDRVTARGLTSAEIEMARSVFGDAIDYAPVRIEQRKWAFFQPRETVMAPTGCIHFHPKGTRYREDFACGNLDDQGLLIHELTHIWQSPERPVSAAAPPSVLPLRLCDPPRSHAAALRHRTTGRDRAAYVRLAQRRLHPRRGGTGNLREHIAVSALSRKFLRCPLGQAKHQERNRPPALPLAFKPQRTVHRCHRIGAPM